MSELTPSYLKECLHYCPETGVFTWRERPVNHFKSETARKAWNTRYSGKKCGTAHSSCRTFYSFIAINSKRYYAHRLAWLYQYGEFPKNHIDHIDGDGINNKINNLRDVTCSENRRNTRLPTNNSSGVKGVTWRKNDKKWQAQLKINGKNHHLGCFSTIEEAAAAREFAELKFGFTHNI